MNIEKGIPMPKSSGRGRPPIYPFRTMSVGESVFIDGQRLGGSAYAAAMQHGRLFDKKFSGRTVDGGVRIWRTA